MACEAIETLTYHSNQAVFWPKKQLKKLISFGWSKVLIKTLDHPKEFPKKCFLAIFSDFFPKSYFLASKSWVFGSGSQKLIKIEQLN